MPSEKEIAELLKENIQASNRTTHAIRAFVRFLFIQLAFYTAAFVLWQIALRFPDQDNCGVLGCEPHFAWSLLVGTLVITGVFVSTKAGWSELALSNVPGPESQTNDSQIVKSFGDSANETKGKAKNWAKDPSRILRAESDQ